MPSPSHWPVQSVLTWSDNRPVKEGPNLRAERTIVTIPEPDESTPLFKRVKLEGDEVDVQALLDQVGTQTGHPVEFHPVAQAMTCPREWYHTLSGSLIAVTGGENSLWSWWSVAQ